MSDQAAPPSSSPAPAPSSENPGTQAPTYSEGKSVSDSPTNPEGKSGSNSQLDALFKKAPGDSPTKPEDKLTAAQKAEIKKWKVKVNGADREVTEEEMIRDYQLREASNQKFQEASQRMKQVEEMVRILKTDPKRALSHPEIGVDVRKFAEQILSEALEDEIMDPKDKALRTAQAERKELEDKLKAIEESKRSEEESKQVKHWEGEYTKQIDTALATAKLPKNASTINRCRDYMLIAIENGYPDITAEQVMPYVKQDFIDEVRSLFGNSEAEAIAAMVGEDGIKKLRSYDVDRVKKPALTTPAEQAPEKAERGSKRQLRTVNSYFEELNKKFKD